MVIFLWKISQGLVHGYTVNFTGIHGRRGRTAIPRDIVSTSSASVKRARESSIGVKGVNIFNLLPASVRSLNTNNFDVFKEKLDAFLAEVPDQPTIAGLGRSAASNSLLHQIPLVLLNS